MLEAFEDTGIDHEQLVGVDRGKVDEALEVVSIPESAVYEVFESEYVRRPRSTKSAKRRVSRGSKTGWQ